MIKSFSDKEAERIFNGYHSKKYSAIQKVIKRKLVHFAFSEQDLIVPLSNHFEYLKGDLKGYCSIRINDQFRVVFTFTNGYAENVQIPVINIKKST